MIAAPATLRGAGVRRTLVLALLARIPIGALSLLIILAVRETGRSYALAGVASGACALGMAISAPLMGRLMDRLGQTTILLASAAATTVTFAGFAALPATAPGWACVAVAGVCGLALPPVSASVRVIWRSMLDGAAFNRVVTLDASLQEISFMIGPLVLVTLATQIGAAEALAVTGVVWAAITIAFGLLPETRAVHGVARTATASILGPVRDRGVRTLVIVAVAMGFCIGATELGVVTVAESHGARGYIGVLYGMWSLGSLAGGLFAMRHATGDPVGRTAMLLVVVGTATALLALAPGPVVLGVLLLLAGIANAPLFGTLYTVMADIAPRNVATEAYSLQTAGLTIGIAVGAAVAGAIASARGPHETFLAAALALAAGAAVYHRAKPELRIAAADGARAAAPA